MNWGWGKLRRDQSDDSVPLAEDDRTPTPPGHHHNLSSSSSSSAQSNEIAKRVEYGSGGKKTKQVDLVGGGGDDDDDTTLPSFDTSLRVWAPVIVVLFLLLGSLVFSLSESWTFFEALYFCVVSLSTVGYGDDTPDKTGTKIFCILYIYTGLAFITSAVGVVIGRTVGGGLCEDKTSSQSGRGLTGLTRNQREVLRSLATICVLGGIGTIFYCANEDLSFVDGLYFAMITLASVGYGDISVHKESTKVFDTFYILFGVALMAASVGKFAVVLARREQEKQIARFVARGVSASVIRAMDDDGSGQVSFDEFLAYMLCSMGKVQPSDIHQLRETFRNLDADGSGTLDVDDIHDNADGKAELKK